MSEVVSAQAGNGVFDSEVVRRLALAFETAWGRAAESGLFDAAADPGLLREAIAKRIVETAKGGERDPDRLVEDALRHLAVRGANGAAAGAASAGRAERRPSKQ